VTALVSGVLHVPYRVFLPALAVGTLVNSSFWMGLGYFFGPGVIAALHGLEITAQMLVSVALLAILTVLTWHMRRAVLPSRRVAAFRAGRIRKVEAAVLAGLVAPVASLLFIPAGMLWAVLYALWIEPGLRGPDWLRGMTFSVMPTAFSWLVVLPALGAGPLGLSLDVGLALAAGEVVRHAVYGVALGLTYPILLLARSSSGIRSTRVDDAVLGSGQLLPGT
jgi:hypothetical protein